MHRHTVDSNYPLWLSRKNVCHRRQLVFYWVLNPIKEVSELTVPFAVGQHSNAELTWLASAV